MQFLLVHIRFREIHVHSSRLTCKDLFLSLVHSHILSSTLYPLLSPACNKPPVTWTNSYSSKNYVWGLQAEADLGFIGKVFGNTMTVFLTPSSPIIWPRHFPWPFTSWACPFSCPSGLCPSFSCPPVSVPSCNLYAGLPGWTHHGLDHLCEGSLTQHSKVYDSLFKKSSLTSHLKLCSITNFKVLFMYVFL